MKFVIRHANSICQKNGEVDSSENANPNPIESGQFFIALPLKI